MEEKIKIVEAIINKKGSIKLSQLQREIENGKEIIAKLDLATIDFNGESKAFDKLSEPSELIQHLSNSKKISELREEYVSHYTSMEKLKKILENQTFYLNNPLNMNDGLEFNGDSYDCSNLFFASFSLENSENMGMWSMYGQPWEQGVRISIPKKIFIKWKNKIDKVYLVDEGNKELSDCFKPSISCVAYAETSEDKTINKLLFGETKENTIIKNVDFPILAGYIKDSAWIYEKEIRLRVDLAKTLKEKTMKVAVKIPGEVLSEMIITTGPRFLEKYNISEFRKKHKVKKSIYTDKLTYIYCDKCEYRKKKS